MWLRVREGECYASLANEVKPHGRTTKLQGKRKGGTKFRLPVWHACHTLLVMKMTMHIDEDVLAEVVKITGVESKTKAVETALTEMVRRHRLKTLGRKGLGLTSEELKKAWEDPFPEESLKAAEAPAAYARKSSRR